MKDNKIRQLVLAGFFAALTVVGAFIKIPFYPVPLTLQTLMTALAGLSLQPRWAALSQIVYLMLGLLGAPVFANGGGVNYILRPTFGYLVLLPLAAWLIAYLRIRMDPEKLYKSVVLVVIGHLIILFGGGLWLYFNMKYISLINIKFGTAMATGAIAFFPAMVVKAFLAAILAKKLRQWI